jgi:hypothetical protein
MPYQIREVRGGLEIRSWEKRNPGLRAAAAAVALVAAGSASAASFGIKAGIFIGLTFSLFVFLILTAKANSARLEVTKFEFSANVPRPRGKENILLNTANVGVAGIRDGKTFGIRNVQHGGLYAVKSVGSSSCILRFLDMGQTSIVISAIEKRFPGLAEMWQSNLHAGRQSLAVEKRL